MNEGMRKEKMGRVRNSNLELFRIFAMLMIVAHHYVVNSGLLELINAKTALTANDIFLLLLSWGGKPGINCFVLITGYYMCCSKITVKKIVKLLGTWFFYNIIIYFVFLICGYEVFSVKELIKTLIPFSQLGTSFMPSFVVFYLFIPFINRLIFALKKREHLQLLILSLFIYTVLPSFLLIAVPMNYIVWFMVIYLLAAYIRLYPEKWFEDAKLWGFISLGSVLLACISVVIFFHIGKPYFWVSDSNKVLAVFVSVSLFMFFKNLHIGYSKVINTVGMSTFGILLIHANSDTMRKWLWGELFHNTEFYNSKFLLIHAFVSIISTFIVCSMIDIIRVNLLKRYMAFREK